MKVQFVQPAHRGAVAQFELELLLEITVELDAGPMHLAGLGGVFQHRHEQIADTLQFDFASPARSRLGDESIDAAPVKQLDPQPHHAISPAELLANRYAWDTQPPAAGNEQ